MRVVTATVAAAISAAVLGLAAGGARADEEKVALDKLPEPVVAAVKKRFPHGEMTGASKETEDGKTVYEVSVKDGGTKLDVTVSADGKIAGIEKGIAAKDLPQAVTEALAKKYPHATHKTVEEVIKVADGKETTEYYEVLLVTADKKTVEVEVKADGTIKKTEEKKEGKKD